MSSPSKVVVFGRVVAMAAVFAACGNGGEGAQAIDDGVADDTPSAAPPVSEGPAAPANASAPAETPAGAEPLEPVEPVVEGNPNPVAVAPVTEPTGNMAPAAGPPEDAPPAADPAPEAPTPEAPTPEAPAPLPEVAVGPEPDVATRARCTGTDPISCHFGGPPGNYDVTVVLGGPAAANTIVRAETRRTLLAAVATGAGETRRLTFSVNVRQPEGEPIQAVPPGTPGLDLYFVGAAGAPPAVESIGFRPSVEPLVIYIAGDSTVADQTGIDYGGWGQQLPQHFGYPVVVANYSDSGESSGSFLNARPLFATIESQLTAKDWVLIQFGHNDKEVAAADFHDNITRLVTRVKAQGASPVLVTPVARAQFNGNQVSTQHINGVGANLPQIIRQVGDEQSVPVLDMTVKTSEWLQESGPNGWQVFHALGTDVTHTNDAGALVEAGFVRDLIVEAGLEPLVSQLR
jgi:lysophospholipase L1-like esterase